jgi:hypothetical protein
MNIFCTGCKATEFFCWMNAVYYYFKMVRGVMHLEVKLYALLSAIYLFQKMAELIEKQFSFLRGSNEHKSNTQMISKV